jgi:hypothetical protein
MNTRKVLEERGGQYGDFTGMAILSQELKEVLVTKRMSPSQRECMEMICVKLARLAVGNPNHKDSWVDIAGYATLAADRTP